ncbi:MAG: DUF559 domain-containing protein [Nitrospirae bacterium]|nr:DUF559 domain-containing protein [Nitrospirota bacterium]
MDFFCPDRRMVIEADGDVHASPDRIRRDERREEYLRGLGIVIVHYTNDEILQNLERVIEDLWSRLQGLSTSRQPLLTKEGGLNSPRKNPINSRTDQVELP